ncbi:general transcription factor II-I repeat domain-containing protein 2-like [Rhopalosiphum padi]|uniref:general transcription factor II-I repeat domain-containing protein 2-like n=1 Tax=Rhopalosiphum padi TaxID=40932 RepID=UPI00298E9702|nr:general transcription factor II-I repeat domain-containing protein 2-like [Rhopalosiphum padi]
MERKKRKVEAENRQFLAEWTDLYCFTLPNRVGALPVCSICQQTVAIIKSSNLKRHYETKHKSFSEKYQVGSNLRKSKIESLYLSYSTSTQIIDKAMSEQEKCTEASMRISWILAKHMKPFTDADIIKECMIEAGNALFDSKNDIMETIRNIPLSTSSNTRNTELLAKENHSNLIQSLSATGYYVLAMDESCDKTDTAQLCIFVRYFDNTSEQFVEEILTILPLLGTTCGEDIYKAVIEYFEKYKLDMKKLISLTTDGAPSMIGNKKSFVQRLINNPKCNNKIISYHCIIHQSVLCCKLNLNLEATMTQVIKIVNFIRAKSSLKHRQFKSFLDEVKSQYGDLQLYNNVSSDQLCAKDYLDFLEIKEHVTSIAFLTDIFKHINDLNFKLQGKGKLVCHLLSEIKCFSRKMDLFCEDIENERLHFPNLNTVFDDAEDNNDINLNQFINFIKKLKSEFEDRFTDFKKIENMEIIEFQEDMSLKEKFTQVTNTLQYDQFWMKYVCSSKYPELKRLVSKLYTMFGSTYVCEAAFSKMKFIKNNFRSRLTDEHLIELMQISCTNFTPNIRKLVKT